jgi:hypothetical protein
MDKLSSEESARIRSEVENPFGQFSAFFLYPGLFAAAGLASYFAATGLLAENLGFQTPKPDSLPSLGIDLVGLAFTGYLWRREFVANEQRQKRIRMGAAIGNLRVVMAGGPLAGKRYELKDFRTGGDKSAMSYRIVLCAGNREALSKSLREARTMSSLLVESDFIVVPLLLEGSGSSPEIVIPEAAFILGDKSDAREHLAGPISANEWRDYFSTEVETALGQGADVMERGLTIVIKKNGRVSNRNLSLPNWNGLVGDVNWRKDQGLDVTNI